MSKRAEAYEELTVPKNGLVITAGVDVQHDRLAVIIRAREPEEESWLMYWGEIPGETMTPEQGAWIDLANLLDRKFKTPSGATIKIRSASIDSSDGQMSDAVYSFVRKRRSKGYMAIKGSSVNDDSKEIFTTPKPSIDLGGIRHKSARYGLTPFIVGTSRAKDLILGVDAKAGRIKLVGDGPGHMHWSSGVRPDYWEQITSEVKAPTSRSSRRVWQKSGVRNEALDCEVYALHAARSLKLHLWSSDRWQMELQSQMQIDLLPAAEQAEAVAEPAPEARTETTGKRDDFYDAFIGGSRSNDSW